MSIRSGKSLTFNKTAIRRVNIDTGNIREIPVVDRTAEICFEFNLTIDESNLVLNRSDEPVVISVNAIKFQLPGEIDLFDRRDFSLKVFFSSGMIKYISSSRAKLDHRMPDLKSNYYDVTLFTEESLNVSPQELIGAPVKILISKHLSEF